MLASSLNTCGSLPSGLRDLCLSRFFKHFLPPSQRISFPCSRPSSWSLVPRILTAGLTNKNGDAELQGPWFSPWLFEKILVSIQQKVHNFFTLPDVLLVAALVVLHVLRQIELSVGFGFPNFIAAHLDSVLIPPGLLNPCFPSLVHFLLMLDFCQEQLVHPHRPPTSFALQGRMDHSGSWRRWSLTISQFSWTSLRSWTVPVEYFQLGPLTKSSLLKSMFVILPFALFLPMSILNSNPFNFVNLCCGASFFFDFLNKCSWMSFLIQDDLHLLLPLFH